MNLLTIDTTLNKMFITLGSDSFFDSSIVESDGNKYHSAYLMSTIAGMLKKHGMSMPDVNAVVANIGPGSFTGIRVGLTAARVIAQAQGIPAVGISSLEIVAGLNNTNKPSLVIMDARKNKAYVGIFGKEESLEPCLMDIEDALKLANNDDRYFVVSDGRLISRIDNAISFEEQDFDFGKVLFDIAKTKLSERQDFNWANLKPLYLQTPPISISKK